MGRGHVISQHITGGEGKDQPHVSIAQLTGRVPATLPGFSSAFHFVFYLVPVSVEGISTWVPSHWVSLWALPVPPAPPKPCCLASPDPSPNLPTPEQKPGWGLGVCVCVAGGGGLSSLDLGSPRTQGKRTECVPAGKTAPSTGLAQNKEEGAPGSGSPAFVFFRVLTKIPLVSVTETHTHGQTHTSCKHANGSEEYEIRWKV